MTTIVITKKRAIQVTDDGYILAKWNPTINKKAEEPVGWSGYKYPSTIERCVDVLIREFISDLDLTISLQEFRGLYEDMLHQIKAKINGEGD
jgi:hypothetical protein